jgi:hypothetical protein
MVVVDKTAEWLNCAEWAKVLGENDAFKENSSGLAE